MNDYMLKIDHFILSSLFKKNKILFFPFMVNYCNQEPLLLGSGLKSKYHA